MTRVGPGTNLLHIADRFGQILYCVHLIQYSLLVNAGGVSALGVREFIGDELGHVDGAGAAGALGAGVVWSVDERLVRAVERAQCAAGAEPDLLRTFAGHHRLQVVDQVLVASRLVEQNVYARLVGKLFELRLFRQCF